ncbi:MAG TPA: AAA family ATPase, partial [Candidatus Nitrosotenuis sp.]|nr:AAA family ATPase [Candidatus Nitrosotenuis sp.]
ARLQDAERPLASLLFVGPTGVGKTHLARSLAAYLFGDEERLVRFDMNEYGGPGAAARLVGSPGRPEGLLTSALRRQPYCVLLLDEVEKAHPEVLNLLLQVMGDGRLTDALGRTADFTQAILILTSNLGAREASASLGLRPSAQGESRRYLRAVETFFSPELFNRLDRVVCFRRLSPQAIRTVAGQVVSGLLEREGLGRRQCILEVEPAALERIADRGFHPHLGVRALKRAVEAEVVAPVAARLAAMPPHAPAVIRLAARGEQVEVGVHPLLAAPLRPPAEPPADLDGFLDRLEASLARFAPEGALSAEELSSVHLLYFAARDQLRRVRAQARRLSGGGGGRGRARALARCPGCQEILTSAELRGALRQAASRLPSPVGRAAETERRRRELVRGLGLLGAMLAELEVPGPAGVLLTFAGDPERRRWLAGRYAEVARSLDLAAEEREGILCLTGPQAWALFRGEEGTHLFCAATWAPLRVRARPLEEGPLPPEDLPPVVRVYDEAFGTLDVTTGWMLPGELPGAEELRAFLLEALAAGLPSEA